jgi:hypothetical protein
VGRNVKVRRSLGLVALVAGAFVLVAPLHANAQQGGGTIKIGPDDEGTPNAPHQGCVFLVEFAGFPEDVADASITITVVPPSSSPATTIVDDTFVLQKDPAGGAGDFDGSKSYDVGAQLTAGFTPNENQGFHVRVDVDFPGGPTDGSKVFWVTCAPPTTTTSTSTTTTAPPTTTTAAPTTTTTAQVAGVQVTTTTTAPAALAATGSPATYWYLLAGFAFLLGGVALYGSTLRRLLHIRR